MLLAYQVMAESQSACLKHDQANIAVELADVLITLLGIAVIKGMYLAQAEYDKESIKVHRVTVAQGHKH